MVLDFNPNFMLVLKIKFFPLLFSFSFLLPSSFSNFCYVSRKRISPDTKTLLRAKNLWGLGSLA